MNKTIKVQGMSCQHCAMAVTKALRELDGISQVKIDLEAGEATYDEAQPVDDAAIKAAIEKAGYKVGG